MLVDLFQEWVYFREITVPTCYFDILMLFIVLLIEFKLFFLQYSIEECFIKKSLKISLQWISISFGTTLSTQHRYMQQLQPLRNTREDVNMSFYV